VGQSELQTGLSPWGKVTDDSDLFQCHCDFGGLKYKGRVLEKSEVPKHYRIKDSILRKNGLE
jgi:hypothetical protein